MADVAAIYSTMFGLLCFVVVLAIVGERRMSRLSRDLTGEMQKLREDLTVEMQKLREDLTTKIASLEVSLVREIAEVKAELVREIAETKAELVGLHHKHGERLARIEALNDVPAPKQPAPQQPTTSSERGSGEVARSGRQVAVSG